MLMTHTLTKIAGSQNKLNITHTENGPFLCVPISTCPSIPKPDVELMGTQETTPTHKKRRKKKGTGPVKEIIVVK